MYKKVVCLLVCLPSILSAQIKGVLSYEEAIAQALKNNYNILIAKNDADIAAIENHLGNAGFLPKVDFNSTGNIANNRSRQEFSNGQSVNKNGVISKNFTAGTYVSYTLFDGFRMFATKERLDLLEQQGVLNWQIEIENTLEQLTYAYYQIVKQEQLIKGIQSAMDVSEERIKVAQKKLQIGSGSNVEVLQGKLDLNAQKANLIAQQNMLKEFKHQLSLLMQESQTSSFSVDTNFAFEPIASIDEIAHKIESSNRQLQYARKNILVTRQIIREIKSQSLPRLTVNGSYVFGRNSSTAGLALFSQNLGFNAGFNLSWNLFNGWVTKKQVSVAEIQLRNHMLDVDRMQATLYTNAKNAYMRWLGDKESLQLEEENIKLAEQSLFIMLERMRLGLGNYLETKESQSSYEAAITRLVTARYNLKESETKLKRVVGDFMR